MGTGGKPSSSGPKFAFSRNTPPQAPGTMQECVYCRSFYTLGVSINILWGCPRIYSGGTRESTQVYSAGTRVYPVPIRVYYGVLGDIPEYAMGYHQRILWGYSGIYLGTYPSILWGYSGTYRSMTKTARFGPGKPRVYASYPTETHFLVRCYRIS